MPSYGGNAERPHRPPIRFESGSFETLVRLVDEGLGATVLPELVVPVREIGLVTARNHLRRRSADALERLV